MLELATLDPDQLRQARKACACLFSPQAAGDDGFLGALSPEEIKRAYREQAKRWHPDRLGGASPVEQRWHEEQFRRVREAYALLTQLIGGAAVQPAQRVTIAVGGAKGGVGKSLLVANMAVILSTMGYRTVAVDLDLGGANLHLYLGETFPRITVNEYLQKQTDTLADIVLETKYGPQLIGGGSSELGSANIPHARKLKLMRALRSYDADVLLFDLGGDTSYNVIDFFLAADRQIVVTTPDPASYLDAYNLIKVSLYRKLQRIYGPETGRAAHKDQQLHNLLQEATGEESEERVKNIDQLRDRVKERMIHHLPLVNAVIDEYRPSLIVNRAQHIGAAMQIARRIQDVSRKTLAVDIDYLGNIDRSEKIETSARDLVPAVARDPEGELAVTLRTMLHRLLR